MAEVGIVLAAGRSERWGESAKALLPVRGETAIARIVRLLAEAGVRDRRVVLGARAEEVRAHAGVADARVSWIVHREWAQGRTGSVRAGLSGLTSESTVVLWPVDHPMVLARTLPRLLAVARADALATWILPEWEGRGGHPIVLQAPAWKRIAGLDPAVPIRVARDAWALETRRVAVDDPGVVVNLNTPQEYYTALADGLPREEL